MHIQDMKGEALVNLNILENKNKNKNVKFIYIK